ncbi:MAG: hypothetical protein RIS76_1276 [Verrucomicrobiota bacterium]
MIHRSHGRWLAVLLSAVVTVWGMRGADSEAPPEALSAEQILARVLERSDGWSNRVAGTQYTFRRVTVVEEFDSKGRLKERSSKEHAVAVDGAELTSTLVRREGAEASKRARRGAQRRGDRDHHDKDKDKDKDGDRDGNGDGDDDAGRRGRSSRGEHPLNREMLERFDYRVLETEQREGRWTYVLAFEPKAGARGGGIADRILARMEGRLWVDAVDLEPVRIESSLREPVSIGGFLAVLDDFRMEVVRRRLPSGVWVDERVDSAVGGRKLIHRFRGRMEVVQEDFTPLTPLDPAGRTPPMAAP